MNSMSRVILRNKRNAVFRNKQDRSTHNLKKSSSWFWRWFVKTMRKIFSNYVCFSKSPNFNENLNTFFTRLRELSKGGMYSRVETIRVNMILIWYLCSFGIQVFSEYTTVKVLRLLFLTTQTYLALQNYCTVQ